MNPVIAVTILVSVFIIILAYEVAPKVIPYTRTIAVVGAVGAAGTLGFAIAADSVLLWVLAGIALLSQYPICLMQNKKKNGGADRPKKEPLTPSETP